jgi:hypothetical protein
VEAAAHYARQVVERVLWDPDHGWEDPQRFRLDHHQPIRPEESCKQGGRRGVQISSFADEEGGPQRVVQMEDEIWGLQKWAWYPPRHWLGETEDAPKELLRTVQEPGEEAGRPRVEAGRSEASASEPADLVRHWLGETEDASEELLRGVQLPGEEASRPRLHGASGEAPG